MCQIKFQYKESLGFRPVSDGKKTELGSAQGMEHLQVITKCVCKLKLLPYSYSNAKKVIIWWSPTYLLPQPLPQHIPSKALLCLPFPGLWGHRYGFKSQPHFFTSCDLRNRTKAPHKLSFLPSNRENYNYLHIQTFLLAFTFLEIIFVSQIFCLLCLKNMLSNINLTYRRFFSCFLFVLLEENKPSHSYILNANLPSFLQRISKGFLTPLPCSSLSFFLPLNFLLVWTLHFCFSEPMEWGTKTHLEASCEVLLAHGLCSPGGQCSAVSILICQHTKALSLWCSSPKSSPLTCWGIEAWLLGWGNHNNGKRQDGDGQLISFS